MNRVILYGLLALSMTACTSLPDAPHEVVTELAPSGMLRAALNFGNPMLAKKDPVSSTPTGVSVDLAKELSRRLGVSLRFVPFESAASVVAAAKDDEWDIAFLAVDPVRAADALQTTPYLSIEGAFMVRDDSPIVRNDDVDRAGVRIVVGRGSAYDLYLSRSIKHAQLVRASTSQEVTATFLAQHLEVAAGVRQQLESDAKQSSGLRLLPGRFMQINQAMATQQGRPLALHYLEGFVEDVKRSGFVALSLKTNQITGATVAP